MVRGYPRTFLTKRRTVQGAIDRLLDDLRANAEMGLHLGCGPALIEGLINCDLYHPDADRKIGVTDLCEFANASVDYIEAHHVIEHLSFAEADLAFKEWARVVRPGGLVVISCPDFDRLAKRWILRPRRRWTDTIAMVYGSQEHEGMFHKSGYNADRLTQALTRFGFVSEFTYTPYPPRPTPSLLIVARRAG